MRVEIVGPLVTRELRRAVLRPSWPVGSPFASDDEATAVNFGAFDDDGALVGAGLVLPTNDPDHPFAPGDWQLRGMATAEGQRGRGTGAAVLAAAIDEVVSRGGRVLWCNARTVASSFYLRAGFEIGGPEFVASATGIPHYRMYREVP